MAKRTGTFGHSSLITTGNAKKTGTFGHSSLITTVKKDRQKGQARLDTPRGCDR